VNNLLMMFGSLGRNEVLRRVEKASIPPDVRPEELSVADFLRLYNEFRDAEPKRYSAQPIKGGPEKRK